MVAKSDGLCIEGNESSATGERRLPLIKKDYVSPREERRPMRAKKTTAPPRMNPNQCHNCAMCHSW